MTVPHNLYLISFFPLCPEIRDLPHSENAHTIANGHLGYKYEITNKYYTVPVYLCPLVAGEEALKSFPLLSKVEGVLIHFEASDKQFLGGNLPKYLALVDEHCDPECKILICDKLQEEESEGVTYGALKKQCTLWDVIELSREVTEEDEEESALNPVGYDELRDALQNIIWSNVEYGGSGEERTEGV